MKAVRISNPKAPFRHINRWRPFLLAAGLLALGGCFPLTYRSVTTPAAFEIRISWWIIGLEAVLALLFFAGSVFHNKILFAVTGEKPEELFPMGRVVLFILGVFVILVLARPHMAFYIRLDNEGATRHTTQNHLNIPWNQTVAVRNNTTRLVATPEGNMKRPRLEIVGFNDNIIYVEEYDVGYRIYDDFVHEAGQRYYGREKLFEMSPEEIEKANKERAERQEKSVIRAEENAGASGDSAKVPASQEAAPSTETAPAPASQ